MRNTVVLYHAACNDGFGAAWAHWYWNKSKDAIVYIPIQYGDKMPTCINAESDVICLDYCPNEDDLVFLLLNTESVKIVDHHKTALYVNELAELFPNLSVKIDMNYSGSVLSWQEFKDTNLVDMPYFLHLIQDRDLWQFQYKDTKPFHQALLTHPKDFEAWEDLMELAKVDELVSAGQKILVYQRTVLLSLLKEITIGTVQGEQAFFCNCPGILSSDMADIIFEHYPRAQIAVLFSQTAGKVKYSLRNNNKFPKELWVDVSAVAKGYGGGGHASAAGFMVDVTEAHWTKENTL